MSSERMEEIASIKEAVKKINVNAVAELLINIQDDNYKIKDEQVDLKRIITNLTQELTALRAEIEALKVIGYRANMGTGSTVHTKDEPR